MLTQRLGKFLAIDIVSALIIIKMTEVFNNSEFNKKSINGVYAFTDSSGNLVKQRMGRNNDEYIVETSDPIIPRSTYAVYYADSCKLKLTAEKYFSFSSGIWKYYNDSGELIKEVDYDRYFPFSVNDLDKMLRDKGIYILKSNSRVLVNRGHDPYPYYKVYYPVRENSLAMITFVINGINGEIMSQHEGRIKLK